MSTTVYGEEDDMIPRRVLVELMQKLDRYAIDIDCRTGMAKWMDQLKTPLTTDQSEAYRGAIVDANQQIGTLIGMDVDEL